MDYKAAGETGAAPAAGQGAERAPLIELRDISKRYGTVLANDRVSLKVAPGEIHAVLGENGAGKSTLMKIIYGLVRPDAGEIRWQGKAVALDSPIDGRRLGIGMVFQHFTLFEALTVAQNVALSLPRCESLERVSARILEKSDEYGLAIDAGRLVHSLSVGERQRVEIVRCLFQDPRLIILDEPTAVLVPQAVPRLFETLRILAAEGRGILYISHKLEEVRTLCDTATILRAGRVVGSCDPKATTASALAGMMVGAAFDPPKHRPAARRAAPGMVVRGLSLRAHDPFGPNLADIDVVVHAGEIVGIAGISGSGQDQLLKAISGEIRTAPTTIEICGTAAGALGPSERRRLGLGFVPEDRLGVGAVPALSLTDNALLTAHREGMVKAGFIRRGIARGFAGDCITRFDVRNGHPDIPAGSLSGGNLQKFILGRELLQNPRVLVVAQPTWGLDVNAADFVRRRLIEARDNGAAIIVVSEDLDELVDISDRIAVMADGRLSACMPTDGIDMTEIGLLMGGSGPAPAAVGDRAP